jgi:signal transduction histidine kinase
LVLAINTFLGIIVVSDKHRTKSNWLYGFFVLMMNLWMLSNYFENEIKYFNLQTLSWFLRIDFCLAVVVFYAWFIFCLFFAKSQLLQRKYLWFNTLLSVVALFFVVASLFGNYVVYNFSFSEEIIHFSNGLFWLPYSFLLIFLSGGGLVSLYAARRKMSTGSIERKQINFIFFGFLLSVSVAIIVNIFLQPFFNISLAWSRIGLYGMVFLVLFPAYAILRHGLLSVSMIAAEIFIMGTELLLLIPIFDFNQINTDPWHYFLNVIIFLAASVFGYLIVKSVRREIILREKVTNLAHSLEKANLRLQELDRQKTEFLSIASHQLRTPLSILKGYIELIKDGGYGKPTKGIVEILNNMDSSNEHLIKLADEFLNISRIEQGRTKFVFKVDDVFTVIEDVKKELSLKAKDKNIELVSAKHGTVPLTEMDAEKVRHVVFNFVDNAIKYSDDGKILISLESEDGGVTVRVRDEGIGFNKVDEANFFQKFYRGENVKGTNVTGTGLGLYVCRKFIEAHGGKVWAHSPGLGKGGEFGFWLPLKVVTSPTNS